MLVMTEMTLRAPDRSRLVVLAKRLTAAGLVVIGVLGGSILIGEWPHELPGKDDSGHSDTTETRDGPPRIIGAAAVTSTTGLSITIVPGSYPGPEK
jgi:hypothetical protein